MVAVLHLSTIIRLNVIGSEGTVLYLSSFTVKVINIVPTLFLSLVIAEIVHGSTLSRPLIGYTRVVTDESTV